jgi:FAD binding domain-containing protein
MKQNKEPKKDFSRRDFVKTASIGIAAGAWAGSPATGTEAAEVPKRWDKTADVVIAGAGAAGLSAAIEAIENGASVILVEQNYDIGGHAIQSGAELGLAGGNSLQKKYGIEDSPDLYFLALVSNPDFRYNDRELVRAFCDWSAPTFEWLVAHGVVFPDQPPRQGGVAGPEGGLRYQAPIWSGGISAVSPTGANGTALVRPLEAAVRKLGAQILLEHSLTNVIRETPSSGRVLGITATNEVKTVNIRARKGVIIGTGGHSSNLNFRRVFDARLTEEYQVVGEPYSLQTGDGELAAMRIGASLWGAANQTIERGNTMTKPSVIGCRYGYPIGRGRGIENFTASPLFSRMRATGLVVKDYQNVIHVNQAGRRIVNEAANRFDWITPCMGVNGGTGNGGGPIWTIFDAEGAKRENWVCAPPHVDPDGWFFSGMSLAELAARIVSKFQKRPVPAGALEEAVARYNSFVDAGKDADFGKPAPQFQIRTPPFYAAWSTPLVHDSLSGLRINSKSQVIDWSGHAIPGLYCAGESAGGFSQHGLAKCIVFGRIAGKQAARSNPASRVPI